jgi:hypothetical protein
VPHGAAHALREHLRHQASSTHDGLALQLLCLRASESMGNHDSNVVDAGRVD